VKMKTSGENRSHLPHWLRAFRQRNYRLFFIGQTIVLNGSWMTMAAMGWLLFRLTGDPLMLGLMAFFLQAPTFLLTSFGGVLVDHFSRRKIILFVQSADAVAMAILAFLTLTGQVNVMHVLLVCTFLGTMKAFEMPARQALVADIVNQKGDLANAIALNSSIFHSARLSGPLVAGLLVIPLVGEGGCFLLHSFACLFGVLCFLRLRPKNPDRPTGSDSLWGQLAEGYRYTFGFPPVRDLILFMTAIAFLGMPYNTLLPVFADTILQGDSGTFGLLLAASGLGALTAAAYLAMRTSVLGMGKVICGSIILCGFSLLGFAWSSHFYLSLFLLYLTGFTSIAAIVGTNTIVQTLVEDRLRGRVMSLFGMVFMGALPLGSLLFGQGARLFGAPTVVSLGALGISLAGVILLLRLPSLRKTARPVYQERGILPPSPY